MGQIASAMTPFNWYVTTMGHDHEMSQVKNSNPSKMTVRVLVKESYHILSGWVSKIVSKAQSCHSPLSKNSYCPEGKQRNR